MIISYTYMDLALFLLAKNNLGIIHNIWCFGKYDWFYLLDCLKRKDKNHLWKTKLLSYDEGFDYVVAVLLCIVFKCHRNMCFIIFQYLTNNKYVFFFLNAFSFLVQTNAKEVD